MATLTDLRSFFHKELPRLASGKYAHLITLRHSKSFPVFRTDGVLNTVRTAAGYKNTNPISRLVMFKRKQTTPERLVGRELLRSLGLTSGTPGDTNYCQYSGEDSCKQCPDCIIYGFAIGDSGSERSKVYSDSAFSLSPYEVSHRSFTFNAPYEGGTMSEQGTMRSTINEQDHILPEVTFPAIETLRDPTLEAFVYVLGNLIRTHRYGAQETRTGVMDNHVIGIVLADGEIFSNLHFTQFLYDALNTTDITTVPFQTILTEAVSTAQTLLQHEPIRIHASLFGSDLDPLLQEVTGLYKDDTRLQSFMSSLNNQTRAYSAAYGAMAKAQGKSKRST